MAISLEIVIFLSYICGMKVLELFAGSRSIGRMAESLGHEVFSVDWTEYDNINLVKDIEELTLDDIPFIPDFIWASPDCTTYSIAGVRKHRKDSIIPTSDYAIKSDNVNKHFIGLIKEWLILNPNMVFFIENPTDIWTNSDTWVPRPECHNYKYDKEGNIIDRHCHHASARRGAATGTQGIACTYDKSRIPDQLCEEVLKSPFLED